MKATSTENGRLSQTDLIVFTGRNFAMNPDFKLSAILANATSPGTPRQMNEAEQRAKEPGLQVLAPNGSGREVLAPLLSSGGRRNFAA